MSVCLSEGKGEGVKKKRIEEKEEKRREMKRESVSVFITKNAIGSHCTPSLVC